jgi:hypothetical protein
MRLKNYLFILLFSFFLSVYCYSQIREDFNPHENFKIGDIAIDDSGFLHAVERNADNLAYSVFDSMFNLASTPLFFPNSSYVSQTQICLNSEYAFVVWSYPTPSWNSYIYGHLFSLWSDSISSIFQINDVYFDAERGSPDACFFNDSTFVTVWCGTGPQTPGPSTGVYGQIISTALEFKGDNQLLIDYPPENTQHFGSIVLANNDSQSYLVLWRDDQSGTNKVYGRKINLENATMDSIFIITDDPDISNVWFFDAAFSSDGTFIVVWGAEINNRWKIQYCWFDQNGDSIGQYKTITTESDSVLSYSAVSVSTNKDYQGVFLWEQYKNNYSKIYGQRFSANHTLEGQPFMVSTVLDTFNQYWPIVKINNNKIYSVWSESGESKANILDFNNLPITIEDTYVIPDSFELMVFPNPFNCYVNFKASRNVILKRLLIYNTLGQKVFDVSLSTGISKSQISWDANGFGSGIYISVLETDKGTKVNKLVLIK